MLLIVLLSQQLLDMLGSNQKERAVLLCNYFLFHNQEAWIAVGRGIPEGKMCVTVYKYIQSYGTTYFQLLNMLDYMRKFCAMYVHRSSQVLRQSVHVLRPKVSCMIYSYPREVY